VWNVTLFFLMSVCGCGLHCRYDLASISRGTVKAFGTAMIIAERNVKAFVTPERKNEMQCEMGSAIIDALASFPLPEDQLMHGPECVWNKKK